MHPVLLLILSPLLFIPPGLLPARLTTGSPFSLRTLVWSIFYSVLFLPLAAFAAAMILGTTVNPALLISLAVAMGLAGLIPERYLRGGS